MIPKQGPRPDHIRNPDYDPKSVDVPEARLLGERQLKFLDTWGQDWTNSDVKLLCLKLSSAEVLISMEKLEEDYMLI